MIAQRRMRTAAHTVKHSTLTMQPFIIIIKKTYRKKNTLLSLNIHVVNLCRSALSPYRREVMKNILFYVDIGPRVKQAYIKGK